VKPIGPSVFGRAATSTGPVALRTYTPGVTVNLPPLAVWFSELPAVTGWAVNPGPRSGSVRVMAHGRLMARVTILSGLIGSNGSRTGTASG
jgi:hypothetical protein